METLLIDDDLGTTGGMPEWVDAAVSTAGHWLWITDADGRFVWISETVVTGIGVPAAALVGTLRTPSSGAFASTDVWRSHLDDIVARRPFRNFVYPLRRPDGSVRYVSTSGTPAFRTDGAFAGYVGIARDVTDEVKTRDREVLAKEQLRESEQRLQAIFNGTLGFGALLSLGGALLEVNGGGDFLDEVPRSTAIGRAIWDTSWFSRSPAFVARLKEEVAAAAEGHARMGETAMVTASGAGLFVEYAVRPICDEDQRPMFILVEVRDITARRRIEERNRALELELMQAQKLEALGTLAGGIAHELNTPIQYVGDNVSFLKSGFATLAGAVATLAPTDDEIGFLLDEIPLAIDQSLEGISRVQSLVQAVKDFSHPGGAEMMHQDLARAVETTIQVCRNQWKYAATMSTRFDPALPPVPCHVSEINQVVLNLIINALHAIEDKGGDEPGAIVVETRRNGDEAEIRVQDNGVGIPPEHRDRVFDLFFTTKQQGRGSGQGLALCHAIVVKKHGGSIGFESEPGVGTTFVVRLPLHLAEDGP